jgi:hypothetical protein
MQAHSRRIQGYRTMPCFVALYFFAANMPAMRQHAKWRRQDATPSNMCSSHRNPRRSPLYTGARQSAQGWNSKPAPTNCCMHSFAQATRRSKSCILLILFKAAHSSPTSCTVCAGVDTAAKCNRPELENKLQQGIACETNPCKYACATANGQRCKTWEAETCPSNTTTAEVTWERQERLPVWMKYNCCAMANCDVWGPNQ